MTDHYKHNALIHRDRRLAKSTSEWVRSFACEEMRPLIVCRGPVRKEAIDVFREMGMTQVGMLLSEKDSISFAHALAPELREIDPRHVHRVPDYTGANKEERSQRIQDIIRIAKDNGYDYLFAGYGFMAEDEDFVRAIEAAGLGFIGPCAYTVKAAGRKDEAKKTAIQEGVSVTPGINNVASRALLSRVSEREALLALASKHGLQLPAEPDPSLAGLAEQVLDASYAKRIDLVSIDEIAAQLEKELLVLFTEFPDHRIRLKAVGGGGGKGQRILPSPSTFEGNKAERAQKAAAAGPEKYREVLLEVKAAGVGDNKNVLLELNVEETRHQEIQLLGNGEWCVALGGRDCSLQMHEQKLLEISVTQEALSQEIQKRKDAAPRATKALKDDLEVLRRMEAEAERFGRAVKLDSASTFECIVEGDRHYFMEVNTRIQVEHRVSELCYSLRFRNPFHPEDYFDVFSLVEAMALLARHKERLPKPERRPRHNASLEARLNATDDALQPHAGGTIQGWTDPIDGEIRDDQGICSKNPDTGLFVRYKVAGAYDSNIALLVTPGTDRKQAYERLCEILRLTRLRGVDLATNLEFHYGLVNWFLARDVYAKPTTRFVVPYLTQVGLLRSEAVDIDLDIAEDVVRRHHERRVQESVQDGDREAVLARIREILARKETLLRRPLERLLSCPHVLSGWLSAHKDSFREANGRVVWIDNPVDVLADTYHVLNMEPQAEAAPAQIIWDHDHEILKRALAFYEGVKATYGSDAAGDYQSLDTFLRGDVPSGADPKLWQEVKGAHAGFQLGLELLGLLPLIGFRSGFYELRLDEDLRVHIPSQLFDPALQERMKKVLVPPPATKADEIVAASGGMFYAQEAPGLPPLAHPGKHFEKGEPIYIIEVMKMFNRIAAPFSGTIDRVLVEGDGRVVAKGQPLFKVTPDERLVEEPPEKRRERRAAHTQRYLAAIL